MMELRSLACRRKLASAKLLKSSHTASGRPASSNKTSTTKTKLVRALWVFFIFPPAREWGQSSAQHAVSSRLIARPLFVIELRRPLLDECGHAFLLVAGREQRMKYSPLKADTFGLRRFEGAIDRLFGGQHRWQRHRRNGRGDFYGFVEQILQRHDARHETGAFGFLRVHHAPGQDQIHGFGLAHGVGETLRAADPGNDPKLDFRLTEFGIVGGDDEIALHRELAAAAQRKAGDRGDYGLARIGDAMPRSDEVTEKRIGKTLAGHFLDVGAGGESLDCAGNDHAADNA